jgi:pimeloyl-ACP methyl ester carboxylesterase
MLHGLWMNRLVMHPLQAALEEQGFHAVPVSYRSTRGTLDEHCERITEALQGLQGPQAEAPRVHLLGHSMGGVIALNFLMRRAMARAPASRVPPGISRTLLLGAPVASCAAARDFARHAAGRLFMGSSVALWEGAPEPCIPAGCEVGAIAGCERFGLAPLFVSLEGPSDGAVREEETRLPGLADHLVLPVSHTGMLFSGEVARQSAAFLRTGRFSR